MTQEKLIQSLHPLERKVLPYIGKHTTVTELVSKSGLKDIEVMRAIQWLSNKEIVTIESEETEIVSLGKNGEEYLTKGLPEKRFLELIKDSSRTMGELAKVLGQELNVCIGLLRRKVALEIDDKKNIRITSAGKKLLEKGFMEEVFLKSLKDTTRTTDSLLPEEKFSLDNLKKRKQLIEVQTQKTTKVSLSELGSSLNLDELNEDVIERLTPEMLKVGKWGKFRRYDVEINVPQKNFGRRHFVREVEDYVRNIWTDMGFKEMKGNMVQTSFWNFDSLFTAQDHPVRDMQDTFFIKNPAKGTLPDKKIMGAVKKAHETGVGGSRGWRYKWQPEDALKNVLRTHTTVLSAQTISALRKEDLPAKFFSVGKCFRNETLDYSHLFEFYQVEGIVIDPKANFRHLIGYLKEFFHKMGYSKLRVRPGYFPYTEPSAEVDVYDPVRGEWLELAGAGIFRPEVVEPLLGENVPVLAWGLGLARTFKEYYKLTDIRDVYKNDLKQISNMKLWMK